MGKRKTSDVSRRDFLKGSLVVGSGLVVGIAGCTPKVVDSEPQTGAAAPEVNAGEEVSNTQAAKYSFETPPEPIAESDIATKKAADVVVLGAGIAGLCAAYAAAETGASVVVLEKRETFTFHGMDNGVIGDRLHLKEGNNPAADEVMADIMRFGGYRNNPRLVALWAKESGRVMDRLLDMADEAGFGYVVDTETKEHYPYKEHTTSIQFTPARQGTLLPLLETNVKALGVEIMYETPAVQLLRPGNTGRVTGVIAKGKDGYVQIDATKGVIVCTGGYTNNPEMIEKFAPRAAKVVNHQYAEGSDTGDGILMGMWVGGQMQPDSCPMLWDGHTPGVGGMHMTLARQPWLYVNTLGERYGNEDAPFGYTSNLDIRQPGSIKFAVWDGKWQDEVMALEGKVCEAMHPPFWNENSYQEYKDKGVIVEAQTLEELADLMGVPRETFLGTVARYNELYEKGYDEDFGKDPKKLTSIVKAPFGAAKVGTGILVTCDGLRVNTDLQVIDAEEKPIEGLYAAGNASGDFFALDYPIVAHGLSHGRALTFGWLAGEAATKG